MAARAGATVTDRTAGLQQRIAGAFPFIGRIVGASYLVSIRKSEIIAESVKHKECTGGVGALRTVEGNTTVKHQVGNVLTLGVSGIFAIRVAQEREVRFITAEIKSLSAVIMGIITF